jgi:hypothetical protein
MCAKRGTPPTFVVFGDADDLDDGLLVDAVAVGVLVVVVLDGVDAADDTSVGDATADDARVGDSDAPGSELAVSGGWLTLAEALELRGWEPVHPDTNRAKAATAAHPATLALTITNHSCSEVRSAHAPPRRQLRRRRRRVGRAVHGSHPPAYGAQSRGAGWRGVGKRPRAR